MWEESVGDWGPGLLEALGQIEDPRKHKEWPARSVSLPLWRVRILVERAFNRLKRIRRIAGRYEKRTENYG